MELSLSDGWILFIWNEKCILVNKKNQFSAYEIFNDFGQ